MIVSKQKIERIVCPYCQRSNLRNDGEHGGFRYYECRSCINPGTDRPTRFVVQIVD